MHERFVVWDLPTRLFHGALVLCVAGLLLTAWWPDAPRVWHARLGYTTLALLGFRLVWGFTGGTWSRFRSFPPSIGAAWRELRGGADATRPGHSARGALSVYAMLLVLLVQAATGLFSDDEIAFTGPLNHWVSSSAGLAATHYHKAYGKWLVLGLVLLHLLAVAWYAFVRRRPLVPAMWHGRQEAAAPGAPASRDDGATRLLALAVFVVVAVGVAWLVTRA